MPEKTTAQNSGNPVFDAMVTILAANGAGGHPSQLAHWPEMHALLLKLFQAEPKKSPTENRD